jgi:uncharacterized membrane protein
MLVAFALVRYVAVRLAAAAVMYTAAVLKPVISLPVAFRRLVAQDACRGLHASCVHLQPC